MGILSETITAINLKHREIRVIKIILLVKLNLNK